MTDELGKHLTMVTLKINYKNYSSVSF